MLRRPQTQPAWILPSPTSSKPSAVNLRALTRPAVLPQSQCSTRARLCFFLQYKTSILQHCPSFHPPPLSTVRLVLVCIFVRNLHNLHLLSNRNNIQTMRSAACLGLAALYVLLLFFSLPMQPSTNTLLHSARPPPPPPTWWTSFRASPRRRSRCTRAT